MHRDRLSRFAIDVFEFIFRQKGTKLVVHRQGEDSKTPQIVQSNLPNTLWRLPQYLRQIIAENEQRKADADESVQEKYRRKT
jgi:hypothetical protein